MENFNNDNDYTIDDFITPDIEDDNDIYYDDVDQEETEEMIFEMSSDEFLENEIEEQMSTEIFNETKRNYVEIYIEKYKYLKGLYEDDDETLLELKENKTNFINSIRDRISEIFSINIDTDNEKQTKITKNIYNFFVMNYSENIKSFFINYIEKNKKIIINELKRQKSKSRDVSSIAAKTKFVNSNEAMIINNISSILFDIIPSSGLGSDFIDYIIDYDDDITNLNIQKFIEDGVISIDEDTFRSFIDPFVNRNEGYSEIISEIIIEFSQMIKQNDIDIFKKEQ